MGSILEKLLLPKYNGARMKNSKQGEPKIKGKHSKEIKKTVKTVFLMNEDGRRKIK
jgi:hypothetical protein